jgi:peptide-methionine (S)-S-oxide reductase
MCNFEGAHLAGLKTNADPSSCPTGSTSVSDKTCVPDTTVVGYMGGTGLYPNYQNYTSNNNYSETLRLVYDPAKTTYADLLKTYWEFAPDPTMPEPDPAYQLRIFYVDDAQKAAAEASIAAQKKAAPGSLIDLYAAADYEFWKAEEYHQH